MPVLQSALSLLLGVGFRDRAGEEGHLEQGQAAKPGAGDSPARQGPRVPEAPHPAPQGPPLPLSSSFTFL